MQKECKNCGKTFTTTNSKRKFCSRKCFQEWQKHYWELRESYTVEKICKQCGKRFKTNRNSRKFCSRKCFKEWMKKVSKNSREVGKDGKT